MGLKALRVQVGFGLAAALLLAAAAVLVTTSPVQAARGEWHSDADFNLVSDNDNPCDIDFDATYLRVLDCTDSKIYTYTLSGNHVSTADFAVTTSYGSPASVVIDGAIYLISGSATSGHDDYYSAMRAFNAQGGRVTARDRSSRWPAVGNNTKGSTWDGEYIRYINGSGGSRIDAYTRTGGAVDAADINLVNGNSDPEGAAFDGQQWLVVDGDGGKVYTYTAAGAHIAASDFNRSTLNADPDGAAWDGRYLRVVDGTALKVFSYEGRVPLTEPRAVATFSGSVTDRGGGWKCIQNTAGQTVTLNNASLTVNGFCAKNLGGTGMEVELHLGSGTTLADVTIFDRVTGALWFGAPSASREQRIYSDLYASGNPVGLAFTEERNAPAASTRLGFNTLALAASDADCGEAASGSGFSCNPARLTSLTLNSTATLTFGLTSANDLQVDAGVPGKPQSLTISRSADYTRATLSWTLVGAVAEYQIERLESVTVSVGDATRIEYGNPRIFTIAGTAAGVSSYQDSTVAANRTYQYRIRGRGVAVDGWGEWSDYVFSGGEPSLADLEAPRNLQVTRSETSIEISWTAPPGDFDNYTVQRQELITQAGSTFFGNITTLGGASWLPPSSTRYTDSNIRPQQTYEYRVAAVTNDQVGTYTEWVRSSPVLTSLGGAPANLRFAADRDTIRPDRREFWMEWDRLAGADDYEVQVLVYATGTAGQTIEKAYVTHPSHFQTSYGRVHIRVRGRKLDATLCSVAADNRCLSNWTAWYEVKFTPTQAREAPTIRDAEAPEAGVMTLREETAAVISAIFDPTGADVDTGLVMQFGVVVLSMAAAGLCIALAWRKGLAALGFGMGAAIVVNILYVGFNLWGTPAPWPVAAQVAIAAAGIYAVLRQTGVVR